jgi:predicted nucleotidyltransferase component of viral defense system
MIKQWIQEYEPKTQNDAEQALRQIMQEIALAGLQRSGFFEKAAFYGGTALRIFYGLDRFSEDLDFSLLEPEEGFSLEPFLYGIETEFKALGMKVSVKEKIKTKATNIDSAFLKAETAWKELVLENIIPQENLARYPNLRVKIEVDLQPPTGFNTEEKLLLQPFSFYVKCFRLPDLFAGKMHALLFRKWKLRVKGRDWYDMEWYIRKGVPLHLRHFLERTRDSGDWTGETISKEQFMELIRKKINEVSLERVKEDVVRFIPNEDALAIWSTAYFNDLTKKIKFI